MTASPGAMEARLCLNPKPDVYQTILPGNPASFLRFTNFFTGRPRPRIVQSDGAGAEVELIFPAKRTRPDDFSANEFLLVADRKARIKAHLVNRVAAVLRVGMPLAKPTASDPAV